MTDIKKAAVPIPSDGADGEQSQYANTENIIANAPEQINEKAENPPGKVDLRAISMMELYDTSYSPKAQIVDGLLYAGIYLFVGAPKIGKSFFMAQLGYHIATGTPLWTYPVHKGTVLYLALEDDFARLQKRLSTMFGEGGTENLYLATRAKAMGDGLGAQLEAFVRVHPDTRLIIIDTLQKIREAFADRYNYASDYNIVTRLKAFSDKYNICLLIIHHTRKMEADDSFDMISGTNGLLGAADGAFILQKKKRTDNKAVMSITGRDQQDQELTLEFDHERCIWNLIRAEKELWKKPPDPILEAVSKLLTPLTPEWTGTSSQLLALLGQVALLPHMLSRHLNVNTERLLNEYGIVYENKHLHGGRMIRLALKNDPRDAA